MLTKATCKTCVDAEGKPDSKCELRGTCPDDASTTEKRKQNLESLPIYNQTEIEVKPDDKPTQHPTQTRRIQKYRNKPENKPKHKNVVKHKKLK